LGFHYERNVGNNILDKDIRYYLGNFSKSEAKGMIEELTARSQFSLENPLIDALVEDLAREQGEVLPIELQVVGAQLEGEIPPITTLTQYQALGQKAKEELVKRYLAEVVEDCGAENKEIAEFILYYLTDERGTRPLKTRLELERDLEILINDVNNETSSLGLVLDIFVKSGLVLLLREHPAERYQLVHDYLAAFIHKQQEPKLNELIAELEEQRERVRKAELELIEQRLRTQEAELALIQQRLEIESKEKVLIQQNLEIEIESKDKVLVQQKFQSTKKQQRILGLALLVSLPLLFLALWSAIQASRFRESLFQSLAVNVQTLSNYNKDWEALSEGLKLMQQIKSPIPIGNDAQMQAAVSLQQVLSKIKEHNRLEGHSDHVLSVSFSPDGKTIATASADNTVILWDSTGEQKLILRGHKGAVRSVSFSPDGKTIVTGSGDRTVILWDSYTSTIQQILSGYTDSVYSVSFSHDGKTIASASGNGEIKLWDIDGHLKSSPRLDAKVPISSVIFSPDDRIIASAGYDGKIVLIDANSQKVVRVLPLSVTPSPVPVRCISFSPDGKKIVAGYEDSKIRLWNPINGKELTQRSYQFKGHTSSINSISFSPDRKNETIASVSDDGNIKLWDIRGNELQTFKIGFPVKSIGFSPDGKRIISGGDETVVRLWSLESPNRVLSVGDKEVTSFSFNPAGTAIISGNSDGKVILWDLDRQGLLTQSKIFSDNFSKTNPKMQPESTIVDFSRDGRGILYAINYNNSDNSSGSEAIIYLWELDKLTPRTFAKLNGRISSLSFSPDGKNILVATGTTLRLWDKDSRQVLLFTPTEHKDIIKSISFSPDGKTIATASVDQTIKLWHSSDGQEITTLTGHTGSVFDVKFSPDGETIASASTDKTIKLWNSSDGQEIRTLRGHTDSVYSVSFSPDDKIIASAGADKKIRLWSLDGKQLGTFEGHTGSINIVSFRPKRDDKLKYFLTSASADLTMIVWDLNLDNLTTSGCKWIKDYLNNSQKIKREQGICKDNK
jgi:WD40 repeat protein